MEKSWQNQRKKRREKKRETEEDPNGKETKPCDATNSIKGDFCKFSEVVDSCTGTGSEQLEDALLSEMLSSEAGCQAVQNDRLAESTGAASASTAPVLECDMFVRWAGPAVKVDLCLVGGEGGRESVHQLTQFLKNKHHASNR